MIVRAASPVRLFRPSPTEYKWIRIEPNRPPGVRDDAKVVAQASRTSSLRRISGQERARWPYRQGGCAKRESAFRPKPDGRRTKTLPSHPFCRWSGACDLAMPEIIGRLLHFVPLMP